MQTNEHRVPGRQWRKWSDNGQRVFNDVFSEMQRDANLFLHPHATQVTTDDQRRMWTTTAWNAAWIAACHVTAYEKE